LSNNPGRTPLGVSMRSPLGVFWRDVVPIEMIICFVSCTFYDGFGVPVNSENYYNGSAGAAYLADKARLDVAMAAKGNPVYLVVYPVADLYLNPAGWLSYLAPVRTSTLYLISYIYHSNSTTGFTIDEIYSSITQSVNSWKWPVRASYNYHTHDGHHDPARVPFADFAPSLDRCRFFIEDSDAMTSSDLEPDISTLASNLDDAGVSYSTTLYSGSGVAENQGRWIDWLASYYGY